MATEHEFPPIRACIFDMDGLLIDSEDIYTAVINIILHENGRPDLPWSIKAQLQGRPGPASHAIFYTWAQLPISREQYLARQTELQRELFRGTKPLPGVSELLANLSRSTAKLALATSSHAENYAIKTSHLESLFSFFPPSQRVLGDDVRIPAGRGKPAPDIYLLALETINAGCRARGEKEIQENECLVFEDSVPGIEAGRRAGMRVVWCPHPGLAKEYAGKEGQVLAGLMGSHIDGEEDQRGGVKSGGWPGSVDDGWGDQYATLESFPYGKYGIVVSTRDD